VSRVGSHKNQKLILNTFHRSPAVVLSCPGAGICLNIRGARNVKCVNKNRCDQCTCADSQRRTKHSANIRFPFVRHAKVIHH